MNKGSVFVAVVMLAIFVTMVGIALTQYPAQARFMPLVVGIPGIVLCVLQLFLELRRRPVAVAPAGNEPGSQHPASAQAVAGDGELTATRSVLPAAGAARREIILWLTFIALVTSLILFGFWLTIPVFLVLFLRCYGHDSWRFSLVLSLVASAVLYLVFAQVLKVVLHGGFITQYLLDLVRGG
jgi:hypothetical protein